MYVGAHLPLDVLGGAALGWAAGALVHLVIGAPQSRPPVGRVREALRAHGIEVRELLPVHPQAQRSTCLVSGDSPGPGVFVKVVAREWRDTDCSTAPGGGSGMPGGPPGRACRCTRPSTRR
jgi:hypothetical protein